MAIPRTDLPGHRLLHERVQLALDRCQEGRALDFKESAAWDQLQWQLIRTSMAMANLQDGGLIIIGVGERDGRWSLEGITPEHRATYGQDKVLGRVNAFASPEVTLQLLLHRAENREFLVFDVREFERVPIVCRENGPDTEKHRPVRGAIYVRPPGVPQTVQAHEAAHLHDLLELAAEKTARRILTTAHRVGLQPVDDDDAMFDNELGDL